MQALAGRFPKVGTPDPMMAPLELVQCVGHGCCGLVQMAHRMPSSELYGEGYGYLSGLNASMKQHLEDIVSMAEGLVVLEKKDLVLDIGSNDGTLLKAYRNKDIQRIGMDAKHFKKHYKDTDIVFIPEFFNKNIIFDDDKVKIITSIAMFYDLDDPNKFVSDIKNILHPNGIWVLEQAYLPSTLENNAFDSICQEHVEYYALRQIEWLCHRHGLQVVDVRFNDVNGGSFLVVVKHDGWDFHGFVERINDIKDRLVNFLVSEKALGKTIHLYGASTKGNVLLQYFGIDYRLVSFAAEKNPDKYGCWTPGTHILIMSEEFSRGCRPDYYLVLPWHFKDGFIKREKKYLDDGGCFIFPLPVPVLVSKDGQRPL
jgi:hypothetical protein